MPFLDELVKSLQKQASSWEWTIRFI
jgi:hypothetical protein